jgi:death-on-curing protein
VALWIWIDEAVIRAIHDEQLAEHGGLSGLRDPGLLDSALARPRNLVAYGTPDMAALAAAYGCGIARNHPFIDGNKRTALVLTELFVILNGGEITADDSDWLATMLTVADGSMSELEFATWIRRHLDTPGGDI